jgi:hypothetical protein
MIKICYPLRYPENFRIAEGFMARLWTLVRKKGGQMTFDRERERLYFRLHT